MTLTLHNSQVHCSGMGRRS